MGLWPFGYTENKLAKRVKTTVFVGGREVSK